MNIIQRYRFKETFKGTVGGNLSDPPFYECNVRFKTLILYSLFFLYFVFNKNGSLFFVDLKKFPFRKFNLNP